MSSFYTEQELKELGIQKIGKEVYISKKASIYSPDMIQIGDHVRIDDFCILSGKIILGNYVHISAYSALYGKYGIEIDDFSGCSPRCTLLSATDDFSGEYMINPMVPSEYTNVTGGAIKLKRFTQIGASSVVMPDCIIEEGAVTGAMTFVNKSLGEWSIYAGIPCRKIKDRKKDLMELYHKMDKKGK